MVQLFYLSNPKLCLNCNQPIEYKKRNNKFCKQSCAATLNNKLRGNRSEETKLKISISSRGKFWSEERKNKVRKKLVRYSLETRICKHCKIEFQVKSNSKNKYCSISCGKNNWRYKDATTRSYNEIEFSRLCKLYFNTVLDNEKMFNGWDADVIIPELKIAVLWNGNYHIKKIGNTHSLKQVQSRDKIKINEILKYGFIPVIIKDYGSKNYKFVESKFNEFISLVKNGLVSPQSYTL